MTRHRHLRLVPPVAPSADDVLDDVLRDGAAPDFPGAYAPDTEAADHGRVLRELRELAEVSAAELGIRTGTDEAAVLRFEAGEISPAQEPLFHAYLRALGYA